MPSKSECPKLWSLDKGSLSMIMSNCLLVVCVIILIAQLHN